MNEFELIAKYFSRPARLALVGNGDDAAVIAPREGHAFVVTTDTLIEGRHFLPTLDPYKLGRRVVAVNFSDLAAMGATPRFAMLSLALPRIDETWIARVAEGVWSALDEYDVELIGGNTTRGQLSLSMTAFGEVSLVDGKALALLRSGAQAEDELWVSGALGDAGWALGCMTGAIDAQATREQIAKYESPTARIALGEALCGVATSCIDISDGLLSEANHLALASNVAIDIEFAHLPTSLEDALADSSLRAKAQHTLLATGDAYELLFTAPAAKHEAILALLREHAPDGRMIGAVRAMEPEVAGAALRERVQVRDSTGRALETEIKGWDHFA
jgi:thiamine-monophosphate kinase